MIAIVRNEPQTGVKRYVCDKADELSKIDLRTTRMGSTCFIIEEDANYILNGDGKWIAVKNMGGSNSGESGGGSSEGEGSGEVNPPSGDDDNTYSADGGEII